MAKPNPNACTPQDQQRNLEIIFTQYGQLVSKDGGEVRYANELMLPKPTIDKVFGDDFIDVDLNIENKNPGVSENNMVPMWDQAALMFRWRNPALIGGTTLRLPTDVRITTSGSDYVLQVQEKTFNVPNTLATDHGWITKFTFAKITKLVTDVRDEDPLVVRDDLADVHIIAMGSSTLDVTVIDSEDC